MKQETIEEVREEISRLQNLRNDIYDYDYDEYLLWHLNEAIKHLFNSIR